MSPLLDALILCPQAVSEAHRLELESCRVCVAQLQDSHDKHVTQMASMRVKCQAAGEQLEVADRAILLLRKELGEVELERDKIKRKLVQVRVSLLSCRGVSEAGPLSNILILITGGPLPVAPLCLRPKQGS